jgi:hypothetical protein
MTTTDGLESAEVEVSLSKVAATLCGSIALAWVGKKFGMAKSRHATIPNFLIL